MTDRLLVRCPHCGHEKPTDPIHDGEIFRATTCPDCHEWFEVVDDR